MKRSLTKTERLKTREQFSRVFNNPDVVSSCRSVKLLARRNGFFINRFAVTMVRNYGNAVRRNYARRVFKEIYRNTKSEIPSGYDIIILLYPGDYQYAERKKQFATLIRRADFGQTNMAGPAADTTD